MSTIEPMLVLSTGNLTEETCNEWLPKYQDDTPAWEKGEYGWFVYVTEDRSDMPDDLKFCMQVAEEDGCAWIMFDRDAVADPRMPEYDW